MTKQELIFQMERHTFEKNHYLCKSGEIADRMFLIQEGIVECTSTYDKDQNFVIERLGRGAIINHRSFLLQDDADTDFKCYTTVSVFVLTYDKLSAVKKRRKDLKEAKASVSASQLKPVYPLALDYIMHCFDEDDYENKLRKNMLRVKLKNAIMQTWSETKKSNSPKSISDIIEDLLN